MNPVPSTSVSIINKLMQIQPTFIVSRFTMNLVYVSVQLEKITAEPTFIVSGFPMNTVYVSVHHTIQLTDAIVDTKIFILGWFEMIEVEEILDA